MCEQPARRLWSTARPVKSQRLLSGSRRRFCIRSALVFKSRLIPRVHMDYREAGRFVGFLSMILKNNCRPKHKHTSSSVTDLFGWFQVQPRKGGDYAVNGHSGRFCSPPLQLLNLRPWGCADNTFLNISTAPQPSWLLAYVSTGAAAPNLSSWKNWEFSG